MKWRGKPATYSSAMAYRAIISTARKELLVHPKTEHYQRHTFATRAQAIRAVTSWIENVYNRRRRHCALGQISPVTFGHRLTTATAQAAQSMSTKRGPPQ